jgi:hypothetical protein
MFSVGLLMVSVSAIVRSNHAVMHVHRGVPDWAQTLGAAYTHDARAVCPAMNALS